MVNKNLLPARVPYDRYGKGFNDCLDQVSDLFDEHDIVEVVRCKDCGYCDKIFPIKNKGEEPIEVYHCLAFRGDVRPTDFCSYGVRKGGAE